MSKEGMEKDPFGAFNVLKGGIVLPDNTDDSEDTDSQEDIIAGDPDVIDDETEINEEAEKKLKEVIEKQSKKKSDEVVEDVDDTEEVEETEDTPEELGYKAALKELNDKNILELDEEDLEDTEEAFEKGINKTVEKRFEKLLTSKLGDEGIKLLQFIEAGGNPKEFIDTYYGDASWHDFDIDSEENQEIVLREAWKMDGDDEETISEKIQELKDNGTLNKWAKPELKKLQKYEDSVKENKIAAQKAKAEADKIAQDKFWDDFKQDLTKREDIKGFKVTPKVKENLLDFITTVDKKTGKTAYQTAIENDKDSSLLFAYLAMNKFDVSKLEKQVMSKVTSKVSGLIKNYKPSTKEKISSGSTHVDENGDNPFSGFRKIS